jgi:hypothetical protein
LQASARDKISQLRLLIEQSFDVFNQYGRSPEAVANQLQAFSLVLERYDAGEIQTAFRKWMGASAIMPTPSDIRQSIDEARRHKREMLKEPPKFAPRVDRAPEVSWAFKVWTEYTEEDRRGLERHLVSLTKEEREEYTKYLRNYCGYPGGNNG